jgi:hypothetical protein
MRDDPNHVSMWSIRENPWGEAGPLASDAGQHDRDAMPLPCDVLWLASERQRV